MTPDMLDALLQNIGFASLFVALFWWTLRQNERREQRYLSILDCYGKQLEQIAATLKQLQEDIHRTNEN